MGKIFTFSGPRGVGKTSIMDDLSEQHEIRPIVPFTTREPRSTEVEGKDYHYVTDFEFDALRRAKGMFDVLTLRGNKYGTPLEKFDQVVAADSDSVEGLRTINLAANSALELRREIGSSAVRSIFVLPQCWDDIDQQMRDNDISENEIQERRTSDPTDLTMLPNFDLIVVNSYGDKAKTVSDITNFIVRTTGVELT